MNSKISFMTITAVLLLAACSDSNNVANDGSTTSTVLGISSNQSETDEPFAVNDGAFAFNDSSEISQPVEINQ